MWKSPALLVVAKGADEEVRTPRAAVVVGLSGKSATANAGDRRIVSVKAGSERPRVEPNRLDCIGRQIHNLGLRDRARVCALGGHLIQGIDVLVALRTSRPTSPESADDNFL